MPVHRILRASQWVPEPPESVFPFFADPRNLERLTPPWLRFRILTPDPQVHRDARIDYRLSVRGLPLRWRTRIAEWRPPHSFTDVQERGPYHTWIHRHDFVPQDGGTLLLDQVRFAVRGGWLGCVLPGGWGPRHTRANSTSRPRVRAQRFGADPDGGTLTLAQAPRLPVAAPA